jgi:hypothetical protein
MKKLNKYILIFALSLGTNVMAQDSFVLPKFSDFKEIKLHTGEIINAKKEVSLIQLASDRINKVDYIELKEGLIIDSYDIKEIKFNERFDSSILGKRGLNSELVIRAVMGDGSGG